MERKIDIKNLKIYFHGNYIPLQGIQYIIEAAKILEKNRNIKFTLIGKGQTYNEMIELSKELKVVNIDFIDRIPYNVLPEKIAQADICLGIFGNTEKAKRVIPNKVYESIAMGKAVISADTPAIRELFEDRKNILLCKIADSKDLAEKILELSQNNELREKIGLGGKEIFKKYCLPHKIAKKLVNDLENALI